MEIIRYEGYRYTRGLHGIAFSVNEQVVHIVRAQELPSVVGSLYFNWTDDYKGCRSLKLSKSWA